MSEITDWAEEIPLFSLNDLERRFGHDREYLRLKLHRMVERGDLTRIERGKYTVHDDPMIYATHIETPSFFSYWTALRHYNLTTQQPSRLHVVTRKNRGDFENIKFHSTKNIFGYEKKIYRDFHIFMADKERVLLDCLSKSTVPVEELKEVAREADREKVIKYCEKSRNKALSKRAGFLLEETGKEMDELQEYVDHNYTTLDLSKPRDGKKDTRWKVVVNANVA